MREITIPQDTRTFRRTGPQSSTLARAGLCVPAGTRLTVSDPVIMVYDHCDQMAVSFTDRGEEYFMIVTEMAVPSLTQ